MPTGCQDGIKDIVEKITTDKPWFQFNKTDFIEIKTSPKNGINPSNYWGTANSLANRLNIGINSALPIGKVFYVTDKYNSGLTGVLISPTENQLSLLNAKSEEDRQEALSELEKETPLKDRLDIENNTNFGINNEGDSDTTFLQKPGNLVSSIASPKTISLVKGFLKRIGVDIKSSNEIVVNGKKIDSNAIANITQRLVQIVDGKESFSLPEEGMHFVVEIIQQTNPKLFQQLLKEINSYDILKQVFREYATDENYQTKDGKPDVLKLKKEAIGKILAETIINKNENSTEKPELLAKTEGWWETILNYLRGLFLKSGFDKLSMSIIKGENIGDATDIQNEETLDNIYLQQEQKNPKQQQRWEAIKENGNKLEKNDETQEYTVIATGKKPKFRVSDLVHDWYERKRREGALTDTDYQKAIAEEKANYGTKGHADIQHAGEVLTDPSTGFIREEEKDDSGYVSQLNPDDRAMYNMLKDNLRERLQSYPKGTRFMFEQMQYDEKRDMASTQDFIALHPDEIDGMPDGKIDILDWKFIGLNTDHFTDVPWYNINAWNVQMGQYKLITSKTTGAKNEDFQQTRMIPIHAKYSKPNYKLETPIKLLEIKIGNVNIKNIEEAYLIPVGIEGEKTGSKEIDKKLEQLNAVYKKLSEQKVTEENKQNKAEQLNTLFSAIRQLQMKQNIAPLIHQAAVLNEQIQRIIDEYTTKFRGQNPLSFSAEEINNEARILRIGREALETYVTLDDDLGFLFENKELSEEEKELENALKNAAKNARNYAKLLKEVDEEMAVEITAGSEKVEGVENPEKKVDWLTKRFGTTSTIQMKTLETLYKKASTAFTFAGQDTLTESKILLKIKKDYQTWAKSRGLTIRHQFDIIKKTDKNELINEFSPEFYSTLQTKIKEEDFKWIRENIDIVRYKEFLKEEKEKEIQRIKDVVRTVSPEKTAEQNKFDLINSLEKAERLYDISSPNSLGWLRYNKINKFPIKSWETKEWIELNKPENKPAFNFYKYIRTINDIYAKNGYISALQARTFLPFMRKGVMEKISFGGKISIGEEFLRNISLSEGDVGFGQINPLTEAPINTVPKYFISEIDGELSTDLFKNMALYNDMALKYKYLSQIDEQAEQLLRLEKNKQAIRTSFWNKTIYKDGILQHSKDNSSNSGLLEDMIKMVIYRQKYVDNDSFDQALGTMGGWGKKFNEKLGYNIFPEEFEGKTISLNKMVTQLNNSFQITALGLNPLSSASNFFGGFSQSLINAGTYFTKEEFIATEMWLIANKMNGENKKLYLAAMDYFIPFSEFTNSVMADKLSVTKINDEAIQDFLFIMMRQGDKAIQAVNFFTFIKNSIVENGEVVNTRQFLKTSPEYIDFYKGNKQERDARTIKFEEDVKKLNEEKGILKLGKIIDGEFVIPGIERKSQSVVELRRKVQQITNDALGNSSDEVKRLINATVYGNSFMVFKNWIPRLVDVRVGNLKYNAASDAYEWGRSRMITRIIAEDFLGAIGKLSNALRGTDKGIDFVREMYEKKKADYENDTGKTLNLTESQFIDMVRQNIKNQLWDVLLYATIFSLWLGIKALPPDDDEDPYIKNSYNLMLKMTDKLKDELGYFYNPTSLVGLISTGFFPAVGLLKNYQKAFSHFMAENWGLITQNDKLVEKNDVIKYWMKSFPVTNQAAGLLPIFYPNMAKELGIRMQSQYGFIK